MQNIALRIILAATLVVVTGCDAPGRWEGETPSEQPDFTNTIGMKFKLIPAGEFMMGSPEDEKERDDVEGPVHRVRITKPFYLGVYEVTQGQFEKVMGIAPRSLAEEDD